MVGEIAQQYHNTRKWWLMEKNYEIRISGEFVEKVPINIPSIGMYNKYLQYVGRYSIIHGNELFIIEILFANW